MNATLSYSERCKLATTAQGLDPVVDALTAAGLPVEVEQTGGFNMVATVRAPGVVVGIIDDATGYLACVYWGDAWDEGGEAEAQSENLTLDQLVEYVRNAVQDKLGAVADALGVDVMPHGLVFVGDTVVIDEVEPGVVRVGYYEGGNNGDAPTDTVETDDVAAAIAAVATYRAEV